MAVFPLEGMRSISLEHHTELHQGQSPQHYFRHPTTHIEPENITTETLTVITTSLLSPHLPFTRWPYRSLGQICFAGLRTTSFNPCLLKGWQYICKVDPAVSTTYHQRKRRKYRIQPSFQVGFLEILERLKK